MNTFVERSLMTASMSNSNFMRLSDLIHSSCGIKLPPIKKTMLEGRLRKRLRALGMESYDSYCEFLFTPELRALVRFGRINLMDEEYRLDHPMDVVFCRNVIIYFDRPTQEKLLRRLGRQLIPGGYLFVGHSETLHGMDLPLVQVSPTIYRRLP